MPPKFAIAQTTADCQPTAIGTPSDVHRSHWDRLHHLPRAGLPHFDTLAPIPVAGANPLAIRTDRDGLRGAMSAQRDWTDRIGEVHEPDPIRRAGAGQPATIRREAAVVDVLQRGDSLTWPQGDGVSAS